MCDNQKVEYGFELSEGTMAYPLEEDRFLVKLNAYSYSFTLYDFSGNEIVNSVSYRSFLCTGFQNDKVWIGYYDSENNWQEAIGVKTFEKNRKIHIGYGE